MATIAALAVTSCGIAGLGAGVAAGMSGNACDEFRLDRARGKQALVRPDSPRQLSDAERLARAVRRCRTVDGATRTGVRQLLGGPQRRGRTTWSWYVGETNDALGPGDGQDLSIEFGPNGRVRKVYAP